MVQHTSIYRQVPRGPDAGLDRDGDGRLLAAFAHTTRLRSAVWSGFFCISRNAGGLFVVA